MLNSEEGNKVKISMPFSLYKQLFQKDVIKSDLYFYLVIIMISTPFVFSVCKDDWTGSLIYFVLAGSIVLVNDVVKAEDTVRRYFFNEDLRREYCFLDDYFIVEAERHSWLVEYSAIKKVKEISGGVLLISNKYKPHLRFYFLLEDQMGLSEIERIVELINKQRDQKGSFGIREKKKEKYCINGINYYGTRNTIKHCLLILCAVWGGDLLLRVVFWVLGLNPIPFISWLSSVWFSVLMCIWFWNGHFIGGCILCAVYAFHIVERIMMAVSVGWEMDWIRIGYYIIHIVVMGYILSNKNTRDYLNAVRMSGSEK